MVDGAEKQGLAHESSEGFDPYYSWLGIPPSEQPPNYYRLLGLPPFVDDVDVIASASDRQMSFIKGRESGRHQHLSQKILTELAQAKVCLLDAQAKQKYDSRLRRQLDGDEVAEPVEPQPPPQTVAAPEPRKPRFRGPAPPPPPSAEEEKELQRPVKFKRNREGIDQEMDMTPMVDVTFLLLIFFMVTAAFSLQKSIEVPKPEQEDAAAQRPQDPQEDPDMVTVYVDEYNTYQITTVDWEYEAPSEQELRVKLREARLGGSSGHRPTRLLVRAHPEALHEKVVTALDAGTEVEMEDVILQTVEEE